MLKKLTGDGEIINFLNMYSSFFLAESSWSVTEPKDLGFALSVGQNIGYSWKTREKK